MTNTEKILVEFDEKFIEYEICGNPDHVGIDSGLYGDDNSRIGCPLCGHDEKYRIKSTAHISKKPEEIKAFISTSIAQAIAEEREKMRGYINDEEELLKISKNEAEHVIMNLRTRLSSLDNQLSDKVKNKYMTLKEIIELAIKGGWKEDLMKKPLSTHIIDKLLPDIDKDIIYTVTIDYSSGTLNLTCKGYRRTIGFHDKRELETVEEFVARKLTTFLETIKNYPESKQAINI